jgi:hypothetical protein
MPDDNIQQMRCLRMVSLVLGATTVAPMACRAGKAAKPPSQSETFLASLPDAGPYGPTVQCPETDREADAGMCHANDAAVWYPVGVDSRINSKAPPGPWSSGANATPPWATPSTGPFRLRTGDVERPLSGAAAKSSSPGKRRTWAPADPVCSRSTGRVDVPRGHRSLPGSRRSDCYVPGIVGR